MGVLLHRDSEGVLEDALNYHSGSKRQAATMEASRQSAGESKTSRGNAVKSNSLAQDVLCMNHRVTAPCGRGDDFPSVLEVDDLVTGLDRHFPFLIALVPRAGADHCTRHWPFLTSVRDDHAA